MRGDRLMINGSSGGEAFGPGAVLALFRQGQARTRADLVRLSGLARSTITQRFDALFAADLLVPDGEGASTGGRPPTQFKFNASGGVLLLADIGASHLRCAVTDLAGEVLVEAASGLNVAAGPHWVPHQVSTWFRALSEDTS